MSENVKKGLVVVGALVLGLAIGRFTLPSKVIEKERIVYQDKIIEKKVTTSNTQKKDHKVYTKIEKTLPDGTKTVETKIVNDSSLNNNTNIVSDKTEDKSQVSESEKSITRSQQSTLISLAMKVDLNQTSKLAYGLSVNQRVLGPVYLGAFGFTDKSFGLSVGLAF